MVLQKRTSLLLGIIWLLIISFLFFLPGSAVPKRDWLDKIHFDKWVHFGFFFLLMWLWCRGLNLKTAASFFIALLLAILYGFVVEVAQDHLVKNRSFDWGDLVADGFGAGAGIWYYRRGYKKNRPL